MGLLDKIRAWRYGYTGITGLDQRQNNFKMLIIIIVPFLVVWYGAQYIIYMKLIPTWAAPWVLLTVFGGWGAYCALYYTYVKLDAANHKGLPQATCYFPDGGVVKFDYLVKEDGITDRYNWKDGSIGVEIALVNRYLYQARDMAFPYVFNKLLMRIPAPTGETFKFLATGEFFHKGMAVETPNCEHISFYVYDWVNEKGEWKPIGVINDCSLNYAKALERRVPNPSKDSYFTQLAQEELKYHNTLITLEETRNYVVTLEEKIEADATHARKYKDSVAKGLDTILDAVHTWDELEEPRWKSIFKFTFWLKVLVVILIILGILWLTGWIKLG